jgi:hypothetical protein
MEVPFLTGIRMAFVLGMMSQTGLLVTGHKSFNALTLAFGGVVLGIPAYYFVTQNPSKTLDNPGATLVLATSMVLGATVVKGAHEMDDMLR